MEPHLTHLNTAIRISGYLVGKIDDGLKFSPSDEGFIVFSDADWGFYR